MVTVGLVGRGVVGERIARRLPSVLGDVTVVDIDTRTSRRVPSPLDVVVLAQAGAHAQHAVRFLDSGVGVVSVSREGLSASLFYLIAYAFTTIGAFVNCIPGFNDAKARSDHRVTSPR